VPEPETSTHEVAPTTDGAPRGIDPRGPRFGAMVSAVLLAATVVAGPGPAGTTLLAVAVLLFLVGTVRGPQGSVQGWAFRRWVRPLLAPPLGLEDPAPPRFAQGVGLVVTATGLVASLLTPAAVPVAAGIALVAAFLNAAFGFCLGCEMYLLVHRLRRA
jgi:hypothetical protein